jgi:hypothetical protein
VLDTPCALEVQDEAGRLCESGEKEITSIPAGHHSKGTTYGYGGNHRDPAFIDGSGRVSEDEMRSGTHKIIKVVTGLSYSVQMKIHTRNTYAHVDSAPQFEKCMKVDSLTSNTQERKQSVADGHADNGRPRSDGALPFAIRQPQEDGL